MNRMKRFALYLVVMAGMTLAMSSLGLAQQETMPDEFRSADKIAAMQATTQQKSKGKTQVANSHRQSQSRKQKQMAKWNASDKQTVIISQK